MNVMRVQIFLNAPQQQNLDSLIQSIEFQDERFDSQLTDLVIGVDGGLRFVASHHTQAKTIWAVGDFDSLVDEEWKPFKSDQRVMQYRLPTEKDVSDFGAALDRLQGQASSAMFIVVHGTFGGRRDHELINLMEIDRFVRLANRPTIVFCQSSLIVANSQFVMHGLIGHKFSILNTQEAIQLQGSGYDGTHRLTRPSHGLSNIVQSQKLMISPQGAAWIVF